MLKMMSLLIGLILVENGFCEVFNSPDIPYEEDLMVSPTIGFGYGGVGVGNNGPLQYEQIDGRFAESFLGAPYPNTVDRQLPYRTGTLHGDNQYYELVGSPDQNWEVINDDVNFVGMQPNEEYMWERELQPQIPENSRTFLNRGLFGVNRFGKTPPKHRPHRFISPPHSGSYSSNHGTSGIHSHSDDYGSHGHHGYGSHVDPYQSYGTSHKHGYDHGNSYGSSHGHGSSHGSSYGINHGSVHWSRPQKVYSQIYELSHAIPNYKKKSHGLHGTQHHGSHKGLYNSRSKFRSNDEMEETMMPNNFEFDHSEFQDMNQIFR